MNYKYVALIFLINILLIGVFIKNNLLIINNKAQINEINNFLSPKECNELIQMGMDRFKLSEVYGKKSIVVDKTVRTSSNAHFTQGENYLIRSVEAQVAKICNVNISQLEPIQLGRYTKGEEYKYHYDYFDETSEQNRNQRIKTFLVYLNTLDKSDGGETDFYYLNKSIQPHQGKAIIWNNKINGVVNSKSLHSGKPVTSNITKYIMTIWIREKEYR